MVKKQSNRIIIFSLLLILVVITGFVVVVSCQKGGKCFSNSGTVVIQDRIVPANQSIDSIDLADNVDLILTQDTVDRIRVEAGSNIISGITTEVDNCMLQIRNLNSCNWLRSYDKPLNVYVSVKNLKKIQYNAAGNITTANSLQGYTHIVGKDTLFNKYFNVVITGGCGTMDLSLADSTGDFSISTGTADFNLHGKCGIATFYLNGLGLCYAIDLATRYCTVTSLGTNNCDVNVSVKLTVIIKNIGSVYYTGDVKPDSIIKKITGSGTCEPYYRP